MSQVFNAQKSTLVKGVEATKVAQVSKGENSNVVKKAAVVSSSIAAMAASSPAYALVEQVMATEGTHQPLGIDEPIYFWLGITVFGTIWALWSQSIKDFGNRDGEESSL